MERRDKEQVPRIDLEKALWQVRKTQMLQFTGTSYRLYEYIETGETDMHSMQAGESEHVFRVPVKEPLLQKEVASLDELFVEKEYKAYHDGHIADSIDTQEYKEWVESIVGPKDIQAAAVKELARREYEGDSETLPCTNCKGNMSVEYPCSCTFGGMNFMDITDDSDDSSVSLREYGVADPNCGSCGGTGRASNVCPTCEGRGEIAKYPRLVLHNDITDERRVLKLDLATLVAAGDVSVEWAGQEKIYPNDYQVGEKVIHVNLSAHIENQLAEMGIDSNNSAIFHEYGMRLLEPKRLDINTGRSWWRKHQGKIETGTNDGKRSRKKTKSAADGSSLLSDLQLGLASRQAWPHGKIKDDTGMVIADEWNIRPLRPIEDTLEDIVTFLSSRNYTLGYTLSFIATEEVGPSFYVLDSNGNALNQLSCSYTVRESLENAWLALQPFMRKTE